MANAYKSQLNLPTPASGLLLFLIALIIAGGLTFLQGRHIFLQYRHAANSQTNASYFNQPSNAASTQHIPAHVVR